MGYLTAGQANGALVYDYVVDVVRSLGPMPGLLIFCRTFSKEHPMHAETYIELENTCLLYTSSCV